MNFEKNTVVVVDYGMGNLRSVAQAVQTAAKDARVTVKISQNPMDVQHAARVVLPGQGAMRDCMAELRQSGLLESVLKAAHEKPLFGVCVGMQMLLDHSAEDETPCLGLISGRVLKFDFQQQNQLHNQNQIQNQQNKNNQQENNTNAHQNPQNRLKIPQIGWNQVRQNQNHPLWVGVPDESYFYFVHSFYAKPSNALHTVGETNYGVSFASAVAKDHLFATQFHPEKSTHQGLQLFRNFLYWNP